MCSRLTGGTCRSRLPLRANTGQVVREISRAGEDWRKYSIQGSSTVFQAAARLAAEPKGMFCASRAVIRLSTSVSGLSVEYPSTFILSMAARTRP